MAFGVWRFLGKGQKKKEHAECRPQFAFTWRGVQYTWNRLPQGWKHSPTICHGLIQTALEKGEAPEHLQYIDDIIVWGNTAAEVFEKGKEIIQFLLEDGFIIKKGKVKGPACEIQFLGVKWDEPEVKSSRVEPHTRVAEATEGEGGSSQLAELKAV
ncbi:hypothetical protein DUI87_21665 [Hirundo rustica rustica]|uniref:ribonuclease H n=1 Tax=Hirundo rustica rustica TaxID=333673 RepID=A0A3M0JKQ2_HIRRU|nr:hypothetical protein DUI87_21665 [Hirundo rustica rustica]